MTPRVERGPPRAYYDRKRAEGKKHNAAVICLARRRCDVILAMLRLRQPYRATQSRDRYLDFRRDLLDEWGLEPSPIARALVAHLLGDDGSPTDGSPG